MWHIESLHHVEPRWELLTRVELDRVERTRCPQRAARFANTRLVARELMSRYLRAGIADVQFEDSLNGKPFLSEPSSSGLAFSISHTEIRSLIAVTYDQAIGVDVEEARFVSDLDALVRYTLHSSERAAIKKCSEDARSTLFLQLWTRKEAILKALGVGLSRPPDGIPVLFGESRRGMVTLVCDYDRQACLDVIDITSKPFVAALAVEKLASLPTIYDLPIEEGVREGWRLLWPSQ